jgi:succinate dehydrogenase/fumarate reductase iron-sulfur protein
MKVIIKRQVDKELFESTYEVDLVGKTLLEIMQYIKEELDSSFSFRHQCGSGICGSCSINVNGIATRSCTYIPTNEETLLLEPLLGFSVIRDLIIDESILLNHQKSSQSFLHTYDKSSVTTPSEMNKYHLQSECIKCNACYSACPVFQTNPEFLGPLLLTKSWRYFSDIREHEYKSHIENIQKTLWDCILCGDCIPVCPQGISPKADITFLQAKSSANGFSNPNANAFGSSFRDPYSGFSNSGFGSPFS